ncbi:SDR family NAD(P)-dependent oxidoreductase [Micromonospora sp. NPDC006431]|uniref:SDR family NAD(P)-dependent oxidoreductase n=1 Tax=Micromonospora sp. NPDC006431 TaxID=3364235 RepID=UPI0036C61B49
MRPSAIPTADPLAGLAGKVAMVTGGSRGIGAATARRLASHGALVGVGGRDRAAIDTVVAQIRADGGTAAPAPADTTDADELARAYAQLSEQFGPVELLAAFAGGNGRPRPTEQVEPDEWRRVIEGDLTSTFLTVRAVLPGMVERGGGAIVTMSSSAGRQPGQAAAAYAAAKAGVVMLSKHLAAEMGPRGIRVNCLAPSAVLNEKMATTMTDAQRAQLTNSFPLGRIGQPDDVAAAAAFLLSDQASWITGVTLDISGGRIIT